MEDYPSTAILFGTVGLIALFLWLGSKIDDLNLLIKHSKPIIKLSIDLNDVINKRTDAIKLRMNVIKSMSHGEHRQSLEREILRLTQLFATDANLKEHCGEHVRWLVTTLLECTK